MFKQESQHYECATNEVALGPGGVGGGASHNVTWLLLMSCLKKKRIIFYNDEPKFSWSTLAKLRSSKCCRRSASAVKPKNGGAKWKQKKKPEKKIPH